MATGYIDEFLERFTGVIQVGPSSWKAVCPGHADVLPSLHISIGETGKIIAHCHGGCRKEDWMDAAGVTFQDMVNDGTCKRPVRLSVELTPADFVLRNRVYQEIIQCLPLSSQDRDGLYRRGLSQNDVVHGQYRSFDWFDVERMLQRLYREIGPDILRVPGIRKTGDKIQTIRKAGLLVPVRGRDSKIVSCQLRTDSETSKYLWLSTGGAGRASTHYPWDWTRIPRDEVVRVLRVTEGPLKADVISRLGKAVVPTIGCQGVSTWKSTLLDLGNLKALGLQTVRLAFDMDWRTQPGVAQQVSLFWTAIEEMGLIPILETWEGHKGLDDALLAGVKIEEHYAEQS
jgi:hypothetical protein